LDGFLQVSGIFGCCGCQFFLPMTA
jgi:hypothetical protein